MAVYTHIDHESLARFLAGYDLGALKSFEGIAQGVSNTNYHVFTDKDRYVLTMFEEHRTRRVDLPFFFAFSDHLVSKGLSVPQAIADKKGDIIGDLMGKPSVLINFLEGKDIERGFTEAKHCAEMGAFAAKLHVAAADFSQQRLNSWAMKHWRGLADTMRDKMDGYSPGLQKFIYDELDYIEQNWPLFLPAVAIHGDLFPDNVFFKKDKTGGNKISAAIDFYFSATEFVLFDLAIIINSWCFDRQHKFYPDRYAALIGAYEGVRKLDEEEWKVLNVVCRGTSMRFLLSRLQEFLAHREDTLMVPHDPQEYVTKLKFHQQNDVRDV